VSDTEFNILLNGPLGHPFPLMRMNRLAIALRVVVNATGEAGEKALRAHCEERREKDERESEDAESGTHGARPSGGLSEAQHNAFPKGRY